jgi:glycerol uptake facilitator-like aquaporin
MSAGLARRVTAEAVGTAFLLTSIVGSGIMADRLAGGNVAVALLGNVFAICTTLGALIVAFGPISGAHFNPAVTLADAFEGGMKRRDAPAYLGAQVAGALAGVALAHVMFGLPLVSWSQHARSGPAQVLSEFVATFGLLCVIWGTARHRPSAAPVAVPAYIVGACWFTASTCFANPAVTIARAASDTFTGIRPVDVPAFIVAELAGAGAATALFRWLAPPLAGRTAADVVVPHTSRKEAS